MTHEELDAIASAWPEAARKGYQYYNATSLTKDGTDERYWALVGRGIAWLSTQYMQSPGMPSVVINAPEDDEDGLWRVYPSGHPATGIGPDLLAAVHAAVMAVGKEGA